MIIQLDWFKLTRSERKELKWVKEFTCVHTQVTQLSKSNLLLTHPLSSFLPNLFYSSLPLSRQTNGLPLFIALSIEWDNLLANICPQLPLLLPCLLLSLEQFRWLICLEWKRVHSVIDCLLVLSHAWVLLCCVHLARRKRKKLQLRSLLCRLKCRKMSYTFLTCSIYQSTYINS